MKKILFLSLLPILALAVDPEVAKKNAEIFGFWTLIPPVVAIVLAFITKDVVLSLFIGVFSGTFLINIIDSSIPMTFVKGFTDIVKRVVGFVSAAWSRSSPKWAEPRPSLCGLAKRPKRASRLKFQPG